MPIAISPIAPVKVYQYKIIVITDPGHITDPRFTDTLNAEGAHGWKHKEEQKVGSSKLAILLEREIMVQAWPPEEPDGQTSS